MTPSRRIRLRAELVAALAWVTEAQRQVRRDVLPHVPPQCAAMWPSSN